MKNSVLESPTTDALLTPKEVADILRTTPGVLSVWRTTQRYSLPWVKVGRNVRYKRSDVQAFIGSRTICPVEV